jgi:hypothetical protein
MPTPARITTRSRRRSEAPSLLKRILIGFAVCSLVAVVGVSIYYVTRLPAFTLTHVDVSGGETVPHMVVEKVVREALTGTYLKLIPRSFSLLYPEALVLRTVTGIPRVKDVSLSTTGTRLSVSFTEYEPYALWCTLGDETCQFLDQAGYAFAQVRGLSGGAFVRHITPSSTPTTHTEAFDSGDFRRLNEFIARAETELSLRVTQVKYVEGADLILEMSGGSRLLIRQSESYDEVFENLLSVLESEAFKNLTPGNFSYIDLRFGNKIFVNDRDPQSEATTTKNEMEEVE